MNFFDIAIFGSGIIAGIYLDQTYRLPCIKTITQNVWNLVKHYEPPKKNSMDLD